MLDSGEIDYMIDEWDEISEAMQAAKKDITTYTMDDMPEGTDMYVAFADSGVSRILINIYNERIKALYKNGTLKALHEAADVDIPETGFKNIR